MEGKENCGKVRHDSLQGSYAKIVLAILAGGVLAFLVFPSIMALPISFTETRFLKFPPEGFTLKWYEKFLTDSYWREPTLFSLRVAFFTTISSLLLGGLTSLALVRGRLPGKRILNLLFISPIMIPIIIIAFAVYGVYAKFRLIGTDLGIVIGHTILTVPFVILVISANLYRFDISLELAARNLGANSIKTFWYITLPLIMPGIVASGVFCFIISLDDLVLAMFLIGTRRSTLPIRIFSQIKFSIDPVVAAASAVFILVAVLVIVILAFKGKGEKRKA
jgi:ABC-type spermidine/putrescine transport system permease subunit II